MVGAGFGGRLSKLSRCREVDREDKTAAGEKGATKLFLFWRPLPNALSAIFLNFERIYPIHKVAVFQQSAAKPQVA